MVTGLRALRCRARMARKVCRTLLCRAKPLPNCASLTGTPDTHCAPAPPSRAHQTDNAHLHRVEEGLLIVSPAIFRRYLRHVDHLELGELQRGFLSLGIHRMMASNQPIWTYQRQGRKRNSKLHGMLIPDPLTVLDLITLPEENSLLTPEMPCSEYDRTSGVSNDSKIRTG